MQSGVGRELIGQHSMEFSNDYQNERLSEKSPSAPNPSECHPTYSLNSVPVKFLQDGYGLINHFTNQETEAQAS